MSCTPLISLQYNPPKEETPLTKFMDSSCNSLHLISIDITPQLDEMLWIPLLISPRRQKPTGRASAVQFFAMHNHNVVLLLPLAEEVAFRVRLADRFHCVEADA